MSGHKGAVAAKDVTETAGAEASALPRPLALVAAVERPPGLPRALERRPPADAHPAAHARMPAAEPELTPVAAPV
jgi:hypothetical protein